ncbi:SRPBCC family protein [Taibaiella koreensis]|uniref:SRPBCC family protein n=1 Tax=Taibaiella koreensis TaxID=1268548 RepID=UPI000E59E7DE|nr:SRPBCC domain-containing protein [Taibaiella koreensis]
MNNQDFSTTIIVDQTAKEVFDAINNVRGWWSEDIEGPTTEQGDVFLYHYRDVHLSKIKLEQVVPEEKVVWHILDNRFNFIDDQAEWKDTKVIFEISHNEGKTTLRFTHQGLTPAYECFEICNDAWTNYIRKSLYELITKGKGQPNPKEGGFNASLLEKWKIAE